MKKKGLFLGLVMGILLMCQMVMAQENVNSVSAYKDYETYKINGINGKRWVNPNDIGFTYYGEELKYPNRIFNKGNALGKMDYREVPSVDKMVNGVRIYRGVIAGKKIYQGVTAPGKRIYQGVTAPNKRIYQGAVTAPNKRIYQGVTAPNKRIYQGITPNSAHSVPQFIANLGSEDPAEKESAINRLVSIGEPITRYLIGALGNENENVRMGAIEALGKIGDSDAIEPLINSLGDGNQDIKNKAIDALTSFGEKAVGMLIEFVLDSDLNPEEIAACKQGAIDALVKIDKATTIDTLINSLSDETPQVRAKAAEVLGEIGGSQAVGPLVDLLGDEDPYVRAKTANALGKIGDSQAIEPLMVLLGDEDQDVQGGVVDVLVSFGEEAVEPLIRALGDLAGTGNPDVRVGAEKALSALSESVDGLKMEYNDNGQLALVEKHDIYNRPILCIEYAYDKDGELSGIMVGDYEYDSPPDIDGLVASLGSEDPLEQELATKNLISIGKMAVESLCEVIGDEYLLEEGILEKTEENKQYGAAIEILSVIGKEAIEPLIKALGSENEDIHRGAVNALTIISKGEESIAVECIGLKYDDDGKIEAIAFEFKHSCEYDDQGRVTLVKGYDTYGNSVSEEKYEYGQDEEGFPTKTTTMILGSDTSSEPEADTMEEDNSASESDNDAILEIPEKYEESIIDSELELELYQSEDDIDNYEKFIDALKID